MPARGSLAHMQDISRERGGRCLSRRYVNSREKLRFECAEGHRFAKAPAEVSRGQWCRVCAGVPLYTIADVRRVARERGLRCLSAGYDNKLAHIEFRCAEGHEVRMTFQSILLGHGCRTCAYERDAKRRTLSVKALQALAARYGGRCLSTQPGSGMHEWQCAEGHVWKAKSAWVARGRWCAVCAGTVRYTIERMQELARERGGECLAKRYVNGTTKLPWRCGEGHKWQAAPRNIIQGTWCPRCARARQAGEFVPLTLEDMRAAAAEHGGLCLSEEYVNAHATMDWQCAVGHQWQARGSSIRAGTWCPRCGGSAKHTIEDMRRLAGARGGECLSKRYRDRNTKLLWRCAEGHRWSAPLAYIVGGNWCPKCRVGHQGPLQEMRAAAEARAGACLSTRVFEGDSVAASFRCAVGHRFRATAKEVRTGSWCPACAAEGGRRRRGR